jgi:L-methionine (R)-S-oxide reductase
MYPDLPASPVGKQHLERALGCCMRQEGDSRAVPLWLFRRSPGASASGLLRIRRPFLAHSGGMDEQVMDEVVARLFERDRFDWVGVYEVKGAALVLGPFRGPRPEGHEEIAIGEGVCGSVARSAKTEVVADVSRRSGHIQCFIGTRSEAVAPIVREGRVLGVLDVDSDTLDAFGDAEVKVIEEAAAEIAARA